MIFIEFNHTIHVPIIFNIFTAVHHITVDHNVLQDYSDVEDTCCRFGNIMYLNQHDPIVLNKY